MFLLSVAVVTGKGNLPGIERFKPALSNSEAVGFFLWRKRKMTYTTPAQLAEKYGVCKATIMRYEKAGRIEAIRLSPHVVRFSPEAVEAFEKSMTGGTK